MVLYGDMVRAPVKGLLSTLKYFAGLWKYRSLCNNYVMLQTIDPQIDILIREYDDFVLHKAYQILKHHIRRNLAQDHTISVLIAYAALFNSDIHNEIISDSERRTISDIQESILLTLQRYLYVTNSHSVALVYFTKAVYSICNSYGCKHFSVRNMEE